MRNLITIWRRELSACFLSPVAYIILIIFLLMSSWMFWNASSRSVGTDESLVALLIISILFFLPIVVTVVTMRLFAEEKRSGTIESLMTAPVTEVELVLGKYAGAMSFLIIILIPALSEVFILQLLSPGIQSIDWGGLAGGAILILLFSAFCSAIGLTASLLTRNQVVAAICCFCGTLIPLLAWMLLPLFPFCPDGVVQYFSINNQIMDFTNGTIDVRLVVLYLSTTIFVLFVAVQILAARKLR